MSKWVVDPAHTLVEFSVKHMMITTVRGRFGTVEGAMVGEAADLSGATLTGTVDVASIDTREAQRDGHLKSPDFFDAENHPKLTFVSKRIEKKNDEEYSMTADVTIRGVTKELTFDLTYEGSGKNPWGKEVMGFSAVTKLSRKDFGLNWNVALETGGWLVADQVKVEIHAELSKEA